MSINCSKKSEVSFISCDLHSMHCRFITIIIGLLKADERCCCPKYCYAIQFLTFTILIAGKFPMPNFLSAQARDLIDKMVVVDSIRRITIADIVQHPFFTTDLPKYLMPLPPPPGPVLPPLSTLVSPPKVVLDFEIIEGLGRIDEDVVEELASRMIGVSKDDVWECLRRDDGVQGNAVKVAYMLLKDKRRTGKDCECLVDYFFGRLTLMSSGLIC